MATLADLSDVELLDRLAALDDLMDEARGNHPELAEVRRQIAEQIDPVLDECRARGLAH